MTNKSISPLRRRMIEYMSVRNLSPTTRKSYIQNVKKFACARLSRPCLPGSSSRLGL